MFNGEQDRGKKVSGNGFVQRWNLPDDTKKLDSFYVFHQEIYIFVIRKSPNESNNIRELNHL